MGHKFILEEGASAATHRHRAAELAAGAEGEGVLADRGRLPDRGRLDADGVVAAAVRVHAERGAPLFEPRRALGGSPLATAPRERGSLTFLLFFFSSTYCSTRLKRTPEKTKIAWSEERTTEKRNLKRRMYKSSAQESRDYKSIWYVV